MNDQSPFILYEGLEYVRVSTVLSQLGTYSNIPQEVLKRKQLIGTAIHNAIDEDSKDEFPCLTLQSIGYFQSFLVWKRDTNCSFIRGEERYFDHKKFFCGQIDRIAQFPNSPLPSLMDWKCSAVEQKESWEMQAHLYFHLLEVNGIAVSAKVPFIKLDPKGLAPKVFTYQITSNTMAKSLKFVDTFWHKHLS